MTILQKMEMNNFQPPIDANNYLIRCNFFGRIQVNTWDYNFVSATPSVKWSKHA